MNVAEAKNTDRELTKAENKLDFIREEIKKAELTRDSMQAEIDKKAADYNIYIAQRDSDSKKMRLDVLAERDQMVKDKEEFQGILQQFQKDKQAHLDAVNGFAAQKNRNEKEMNNIREFIKAVQRACSLLGL